jgi:N-acetylmuramoyl-L-alanine amidase
MKKFKGIVIHCSDSSFGTAQDIEDWHKERGWSDIGYHCIVSNGWIDKNRYMDFMDGSKEIGRDWNIIGAHAKGYNDWFGVCLVGTDTFTKKQFNSLLEVCKHLIKEHGISVENIIGHYECKDTTKTCPNFDVKEVRNMLLAQLEEWNG